MPRSPPIVPSTDGMHVGPKDWRPVPDPTVMTTMQLTGAITAQRDLFETRLASIDKAIILLQDRANGSPTIGEVWTVHETKIFSIEKRLDHEILTDIQHLRDLHHDKIESLERAVHNRFIERDKRAEQLSAANVTAVNAAWLSQKEAITKSEVATAESIKQLQTLFQTAISGLSTQVLDVKSRLDKGEGAGMGGRVALEDTRADKQDSSARMFAMIAIVVSVCIGVASIWGGLKKDDHNQLLTDTVRQLQAEQFNQARGAARQPVEKSEVEGLISRMDALSARINSLSGPRPYVTTPPQQ